MRALSLRLVGQVRWVGGMEIVAFYIAETHLSSVTRLCQGGEKSETRGVSITGARPPDLTTDSFVRLSIAIQTLLSLSDCLLLIPRAHS